MKNKLKRTGVVMAGAILPFLSKIEAFAWAKNVANGRSGDINKIVKDTGLGWVNLLSTIVFFGGIATILGALIAAAITLSKGDGNNWHATAIAIMVGVILVAAKIVVSSVTGGWNWA